MNTSYNGHYRAKVISNKDPENQGRIKLFVASVYPDEFKTEPEQLPWAEPAMPLFGGSFVSDGATVETGVNSVPHVGAMLWVFFEQGDHNFPIYTAAVHTGVGWVSEHPNQHVIHTDNVKIRIDEAPYLSKDGELNNKSTCKFDTYNKDCTHMGKKHATTQVPTTLDIEVTGNVNIRINGSVNMLVEGDYIQEIHGNKYETIHGKHYVQHNGDYHLVRDGASTFEQSGKSDSKINNDVGVSINGASTNTVANNVTNFIGGDLKQTIIGGKQIICASEQTSVIGGSSTFNLHGNRSVNIVGEDSYNLAGTLISNATSDNLTSALDVKFMYPVTQKRGLGSYNSVWADIHSQQSLSYNSVVRLGTSFTSGLGLTLGAAGQVKVTGSKILLN